jgi:hypothetical protein
MVHFISLLCTISFHPSVKSHNVVSVANSLQYKACPVCLSIPRSRFLSLHILLYEQNEESRPLCPKRSASKWHNSKSSQPRENSTRKKNIRTQKFTTNITTDNQQDATSSSASSSSSSSSSSSPPPPSIDSASLGGSWSVQQVYSTTVYPRPSPSNQQFSSSLGLLIPGPSTLTWVSILVLFYMASILLFF